MEQSSKWLGWEDSNLRMRAPKTRVLPLDDTPEQKTQNKVSTVRT